MIKLVKTMALFSSILIFVSPCAAKGKNSSGDTNVNGYSKKDGTYIAPHQRTSPNHTQRDNWSSKPNYNPYTGKEGKKEPQK